MKRDWDTIRKILIMLSEHGEEMQYILPSKELLYHLQIMEQGNLIKGLKIREVEKRLSSIETMVVSVGVLTWEGCDLLEKIKDDEKWNKIKEIRKKAGVGLTIDVINMIMDELEIEHVKRATRKPGMIKDICMGK